MSKAFVASSFSSIFALIFQLVLKAEKKLDGGFSSYSLTPMASPHKVRVWGRGSSRIRFHLGSFRSPFPTFSNHDRWLTRNINSLSSNEESEEHQVGEDFSFLPTPLIQESSFLCRA